MSAAEPAKRPNVLLIVTDDQGWGDFGFHGNEQISTPRLDRLAAESLEFTNFYVSPVCSPTRASLLTGRYHLRTGVVDTNSGRSMMHTDEVTLAETLRNAGYETGIFGKWHLGDNYPMRAIDQGFKQVLVHRGGGCGQPADPPGNSYFSPVLQCSDLVQPGQMTTRATTGYITDVLTSAAIEYMSAPRDEPFFAYVAYNCPHDPLQVPDEYLKPYLDAGLEETTARVYGMVMNIDDNVGRLLDALDQRGLSNDTVVLFLTDNGPQQPRYNGVLRGRKTTVYEGGIRTPLLVRYPPAVKPGKTEALAAHIDIAPTLVEACGAKMASTIGGKIDGVSLWPLLTGEVQQLPERTVFLQWHRGDAPELYRSFAARSGKYKLVQAVGGDPARMKLQPNFELFDLTADPGEQRNLAAEKPDVAERLKHEYAAWFADVSSTRGFDPPRSMLGTERENPSTLTRQDWHGPDAGWGPASIGHWEVEFATAGRYDVTIRYTKSDQPAEVALTIGDQKWPAKLAAGVDAVTVANLELPQGATRLSATIDRDGKSVGAHYVEVRCHEPVAAP